jgi:hypothetical protein
MDRRCRRSERCVRRELLTHTSTAECACSCHGRGPHSACDDDGGCGHLHQDVTVTLGVLLEDPRAGFCPACTGRLTLAFDELPTLYAQLNLLHLPSLAVRYRSDTITGATATGSPVLVDQVADALARLIDHELETWAEVVADLAGVPWDSQLAQRSRDGHRVQQAATLLSYRVVQLLAAGVHEYRARSLTDDPNHGHDPATTYEEFGDWWCSYDGPAAAGRILDLHHKAVRATGGGPADHIPVPCGYCSSRTLRRDHHTGVVRCRTCGDTKTDDAYDAFLEAALAAYETVEVVAGAAA